MESAVPSMRNHLDKSRAAQSLDVEARLKGSLHFPARKLGPRALPRNPRAGFNLQHDLRAAAYPSRSSRAFSLRSASRSRSDCAALAGPITETSTAVALSIAVTLT